MDRHRQRRFRIEHHLLASIGVETVRHRRLPQGLGEDLRGAGLQSPARIVLAAGKDGVRRAGPDIAHHGAELQCG